MSFPTSVKNRLLVDCNHRCCKCRVARVQLHHIVYISKGGTNTYENGIPLCSNCHNEVHTSQAAAGAAGVTTQAITEDQLRLYKKEWIEICKYVVHIKGGGLADPSHWHYYWHRDRIVSLWKSLGLTEEDYVSEDEDLPTFNRELSKKLLAFVEKKGLWDLSYLLDQNTDLEKIIGSFVTFHGRFTGDLKPIDYYNGDEAVWKRSEDLYPRIHTTIQTASGLVQVAVDIDPQYITTVSSWTRLRYDNPYLQVTGFLFNACNNTRQIYVIPLHICPNS